TASGTINYHVFNQLLRVTAFNPFLRPRFAAWQLALQCPYPSSSFVLFFCEGWGLPAIATNGNSTATNQTSTATNHNSIATNGRSTATNDPTTATKSTPATANPNVFNEGVHFDCEKSIFLSRTP